MTGSTGRLITALVAAVVAFGNGYFGWHLTSADVLGLVGAAVALIAAEAHVEAHRTTADGGIGMLSRLESLLTHLLTVIRETQSAPTPPGETGSGTRN